jgi:hypothetical protein
MAEQAWAIVDEVAGPFQAEIIQGLLQAQEIPVLVSKPGAGSAIGVTLGALGRVQILVPVGDLERARQVVDDYYSGAYQDQELLDFEDEDTLPQDTSVDE